MDLPPGALSIRRFQRHFAYDSLQALFKTRVKVVDAQFAYTYSKSLTNTDLGDSSGTLQTNNGGTGSGNFVLIDNSKFDYGLSELNRPNVLSGSLVYARHNAPALSGENSFVRAALGSWETSGILQYTSGPSINVYSGVGQDLVGAGEAAADRANIVPGQPCRASDAPQNMFFNPAKFTLDHYQIGSVPSTPRGVCPGPGIAQTDFSIRKNFKITERVTAKFSMDFFNLFNKTQFVPTNISNQVNTGGTVTLCNPTAGTAQGNTAVCPGYGADQVQWVPVSGTGGRVTNERRTSANRLTTVVLARYSTV